MKAAKVALIAVAALLVLAIAGAAVFALTFDPNRYKGQIEQAVKERTGRTLDLKGDLHVAFFPNLGATVQGVTLSERGGQGRFLSLDSAHASVALLPLLHGQVIVDGIQVSGMSATLVKGKDGRYNFEDLLGAASGGKPRAAPSAPSRGASAGPVRFDIGGIRIERSALSYRDLATGQEFAVSDFNLSTGPLADGSHGKLALGAALKGSKPELDARLQANAGYRLDLGRKRYSLSDLALSLDGTLSGQTVRANLSAPQLVVSGEAASSDGVSAELSLKGPGSRAIDGNLQLSGLQASPKAVAVRSLVADVTVNDPQLAQKTLSLHATGTASADLSKNAASADLQAKLDESTIKAKLGYAKAYTFDVQVDKLNADRYLGAPAKPGAAKAGAQNPPAAHDTPVDLSALKGLDARGRLQVGALQIRGLKLNEVKAELSAANGRAQLSPHSAKLYQGSLAGALTVDANTNRVALKEDLSDVAVGPLLRDFMQQDRLEGRGNVSMDVAAAGATVDAMKRSLGGKARVHLRDGAIKGFNIAEAIRKAKAALGKQSAQAGAESQKTDFSELSASFTIRNGIAHNEDLDMKAPLLRVTGKGDVNLPAESLDYTVKAAVVASAKGQGGPELAQLAGLTVPVHLAGPLDGPKIQVDIASVAAQAAKSKVGKKVEEKLKGKLGEQLKGLFNR